MSKSVYGKIFQIIRTILLVNAGIAALFVALFIVFGAPGIIRKLQSIATGAAMPAQQIPVYTSTLVHTNPEAYDYSHSSALVHFEMDRSETVILDGITFEFSENVVPSALEIRTTKHTMVSPASDEPSDQVYVDLSGASPPITLADELLVTYTNNRQKLPLADISISFAPKQPPVASKATLFINDALYFDLPRSQACGDIADTHPFLSRLDDTHVRIPPGRHIITTSVIIPKNCDLEIAAGVQILFEPNISLISYSAVYAIGTPDAPIIIAGYTNQPWGVFGIVNTGNNTSKLAHVVLSGGSTATINGIDFSGALSAYYAPVTIANSSFFGNSGEDAVNVKFARAVIDNSDFIQNASDALDLDVSENSSIVSSRFGQSGGDHIDISFSDTLISRNELHGAQDKCISIGERSDPVIESNALSDCTIAIAVKDSSSATIIRNAFMKNQTALSLYNKKPIFGGAQARLAENIFENNLKDIDVDNVSEIVEISEK